MRDPLSRGFLPSGANVGMINVWCVFSIISDSIGKFEKETKGNPELESTNRQNSSIRELHKKQLRKRRCCVGCIGRRYPESGIKCSSLLHLAHEKDVFRFLSQCKLPTATPRSNALTDAQLSKRRRAAPTRDEHESRHWKNVLRWVLISLSYDTKTTMMER